VGAVVTVSSSTVHAFSKQPRESARLLVGIGVEDDAHAGTTVQHLSRVRADPTPLHLRQVHLLSGGARRPGDPVAVELPPLPHAPLERV